MANSFAPVGSSYSSRERFVCVTLGVASTVSLAANATMANVPMPTPHTGSGPIPVSANHWQPHTGPIFTGANHLQPHPANHAAHSLFHLSKVPIHHPLPAILPSATDLNLASSDKTFVAGNLANFKDMTIQVGNFREIVSLETKLTAAEVVAAEQVLTSGKQTIQISGSGAASGGTITLNKSLLTAIDNSLGGTIGSLTIAHGVQVVDALSNLSLAGNLANYGSILTASATKGASDTISAGSILNAAGGAIESYTGGGRLSAANPVLDATAGLTNNGTISSAGNVTINAPVVFNGTTVGAASPQAASITSGHNVNINTARLSNNGVISAAAGNINVASGGALTVNNDGGNLEASKGNINFSAKNADINLDGGNYLSKQLNLDAGTGNVTVDVNEVSGKLNASGNCIHLYADTPNLLLGNIAASGDPLIAVTGNILIDGTISPTNGADLTLISMQDIVSIKGNKGLDTSSKTGAGGNLTLIAGANFTGSSLTGATLTDSGGNNGSGTGGMIDLTGKSTESTGALTVIKTGGAGGQSSGNVTMVAYAGSGTGAGTINTGTATIDTTAKTPGKFGDVTVIAGATTVTDITIAKITANAVTIESATPTAGAGVSYDATGKLVGVNTIAAGKPTLGNISLAAKSQVTANSDVTVSTAGAVSLGIISSTGTTAKPAANHVSITSGGAGPLTIAKTITGGTITLDAGTTSDININAAVGTSTTTALKISGNNILSSSAGVLSGQNLTLTASAGIGSENTTKFLKPPIIDAVATKVTGLTLTSGKSAYIKETGDVTIGTSTITGDLNFQGSGKVTQSGTLKATSGITVNTKGAVAINGTAAGVYVTDFSTTSTLTVGGSAQLGGPIRLRGLTVTNNGVLGNIANGDSVDVNGTAAGTAITNNGSMSGVFISFSATNAKGSVLNSPLSTITGTKSVGVSASSIMNNGTIDFGSGDLNMDGGKSAITIGGTKGSFTSATGSIVNLSAGTNITITGNGPTDNPFSSLTNLGGFSVNALKGVFNTPMGGISVATDKFGQGGAIDIFTAAILYNGQGAVPGPFILTADGTGSTSGTSVQHISLFIFASGITVGNQPGNFEINAKGVGDGHVTLSTPDQLTINTPFFQTTGSALTRAADRFGPTVLNGHKGIAIIGDLSSKNGDNKYTDIQIITNSTKPFIMDSIQSAATLINGQTNMATGQGIEGGTVSIINSGGLVVGKNATMFGETAVFSSGTLLTNNGTIDTPAVVTGPASGNTTITNNGLLDTPSTSLFIGTTSGSLILNNGITGTYGAGFATFLANSDKGSVTLAGTGVVPTTASNDILTAPKGTITLGTGNSPMLVTVHTDTSLNGGQISISSVGLAYSKGGLTLDAEASSGTVNGGIVNITLTGTKALSIGATGLTIDTTNTATGNGGQISVKNGGNISADSASLLMASKGTGSDLSLQVTKGLLFISNFQDLNAFNLNNLTLSSNSTTAFLFGGAKTSGNGFGGPTAQINATNISITNTGGAIDTRAAGLAANDITLISAAKGSIIFSSTGPSSLTALADSSGNGGTINITAPVLTFTGGLTLNAAASPGTAIGGNINVTLTATKALAIGAGGLAFNVANAGAGSQGGEVTLSSSGNITADAGAAGLNLGSNFAVGKGASLSLSANGLLLVSNTDKIDNIGLHNVVFSSSSPTQTFLLSGATSNGLIYGDASKTFTADSITVANKGGALDATSGTLVTHSLGYTAGGILTLGSSVQALTDAAGNGGTITINAGSLAAPGLLTLNAAATGTGDGGTIVLNFTSSSAVSVTPSGFLFDISNGSNQGGSVTITNNGNLTVDPSAINLGGSFGVGKGANLTLGSNNGQLLVNNVSSINNASLHSLSFSSNSSTPFTLGGALSNGIAETVAFSADNISVSNKGGQIMNGTGTGLSGLNTITLTSSTDTGATITSPGPGILITGTPSLVVNTGTKGSAFVSILGTTSILQSNVGQLLSISASAGDLTVGGSSVGQTVKSVAGVNITYNNPNGNNTNNVTLGNIATSNPNGFFPAPASPLVVSSNAQNLVVAANAVITTAPGDITLQNSNSSSSNLPSISIQAGATIHAGDIPGNLKQFSALGGNVYIAIGTVPNSNTITPTPSTIAPGVIPLGNPVIVENFTIVSFGTIAFPSGSITADKTDVLTSLFRTFAFSTGSYPSSQIVLAPNVTITADPPVPPSPTAVLAARLMAADTMIIPVASSSAPVTLASVVSPAATIQTPFTVSANTTSVSPTLSNTISAISNLSNQEISAGLLSSVNNSFTAAGDTTIAAATNAPNATNAAINAGTTDEGSTNRALNGSVSNTTHQTLNSGVLLLAPDQNTVVDTPYGSVAVAARSVALLVSSDKGLAIYNLHDSHKGAVTVSRGALSTALTPGRSAILTKSSQHSFEEINPASFVAYRNLSTIDLGDEAKLYQAEFQITSMVRGLPAVKEMIASPIPSKRKAMANMLKTAAILSDIMPSSEPFSYRVPPRATACAALSR